MPSFSFDDLKAGLAYLKRKRGTQHEGPLAFVKANLTTFMDCQDTLAGKKQHMFIGLYHFKIFSSKYQNISKSFSMILLNTMWKSRSMFLTTEMHQMLVNDQNNSKTGSCTESLEDVLVSKYLDHGIPNPKWQSSISCEISKLTRFHFVWWKMVSENFPILQCYVLINYRI